MSLDPFAPDLAPVLAVRSERRPARLRGMLASVALSGLALCAASTSWAAEGGTLPHLYTNEQWVADVNVHSSLKLDDTKAVFKFVLDQLPARVNVFPTENYYYFYFYDNGIKYAGNIRFDVFEREKGNVEFIYFKDSTDWADDPTDHYAKLGKADGVLVEKVSELVYRLTYEGKSVEFAMNDLSNVKPPEGVLGPDESYLGPVADESGIRFFLTFDEKLKLFHYILDETIPVADEMVPQEPFKHVEIGRRSGFAFLKDPYRPRRLLVGVYGPNVDVNNYFDGPFDQLPDNFMKGDELRRDLLLSRPDIKGPIDRLGIAPGGAFRESISPYMEYLEVKELAAAENCTIDKDEAATYRCLDKLSDAPDDE